MRLQLTLVLALFTLVAFGLVGADQYSSPKLKGILIDPERVYLIHPPTILSVYYNEPLAVIQRDGTNIVTLKNNGELVFPDESAKTWFKAFVTNFQKSLQ